MHLGNKTALLTFPTFAIVSDSKEI